MDRNTLGHSILLEESKEPIKQMKGKQEDSFAGTAKNDHVDHSEKNVPKDLEALARATKNVPEDVEITEIKSNDLDNKTGRNIGKRNRQDDSGSKTKILLNTQGEGGQLDSNFHTVLCSCYWRI
ncbi:hypothetical protein DAI22_09g032000 [Oryza sativa Japonica Group]|nr:uncharacterized protein LOC4346593 [Oryza sativa Japonica Group]KAF2915407.1 hypothetical protein DAI22_09g032000 [Oryza sativa Japonica Group]